jgi:hypothetical protein
MKDFLNLFNPVPLAAWLADSVSDDSSNPNIEAGGTCPNGDDDDDLTDKPGKIANRLGRSRKEIRDAIHRVKESMHRNGPARNPDVWVNTRTGEVYPKTPGGRVGDSIGNIFDYLP